MHEHFDPITPDHGLMLGLMILGGVASYIRRFREYSATRFSFAELVGECTIAIFVGITALMFCEYANFDRYLTGGLVGLTSHMGTRALFIAENALQRWAESRTRKLESVSEKQNG